MNEIPTVPIYYYFIEENLTNHILIFLKTLIVAATIRKPFLQFQLFVIIWEKWTFWLEMYKKERKDEVQYFRQD